MQRKHKQYTKRKGGSNNSNNNSNSNNSSSVNTNNSNHTRNEDITYWKVIKSIRDDDYQDVKQSIDDGFNVNQPDPDFGFTPLFYAAKFSNIPIIQLLLDAGSDIKKEVRGQTPLTWAHQHNPGVIQYLKNKCPEPCIYKIINSRGRLIFPNNNNNNTNNNNNNTNSNSNSNNNSESSNNEENNNWRNNYYRQQSEEFRFNRNNENTNNNNNNNNNGNDIDNEENATSNQSNNNVIIKRNNINNISNIGKCFDVAMYNNNANAKNFLKEDINNIVLIVGKKAICINRKQIKKYTQLFYECKEDNGKLSDDNVISNIKYGKLMPYNQFISENDLDLIQNKDFVFFKLNEIRDAKAFVSVEIKNHRGSFVSGDHCQGGSGGKIYGIKGYSLSEGIELIKSINKNNRTVGGGKRKTQKKKKSHK
jgi:hypothetical protein